MLSNQSSSTIVFPINKISNARVKLFFVSFVSIGIYPQVYLFIQSIDQLMVFAAASFDFCVDLTKPINGRDYLKNDQNQFENSQEANGQFLWNPKNSRKPKGHTHRKMNNIG